MNGCSALRLLLICIMCMAPSAFMHVSVIPHPWVTYNKQLTGHEFHIVCTSKWLVESAVHPTPWGGGGVTWQEPSSLGDWTGGGGGGTLIPRLTGVSFVGAFCVLRHSSLDKNVAARGLCDSTGKTDET